MRLAIAVPSHDHVSAYFANDLARMYAATRAEMDAELVSMIGTFVHHAREKLLDDAVTQLGATHILWLDSDMRFPPGTALRLLARDRDVIAANYVMRTFPHRSTARRDGKRVQSFLATGIEEVDHVGMGVFLMRTSILENVPRPRFFYSTPTETEDVFFCRQLRAAGHSIFIDHDLSQDIGHVGQHTFRAHDDGRV